MGKVLLIGGSPMIGKSTVARRMASQYEIQSLSTDDIGEMLQTVVDINPMKGMDYLKYYENVDVKQQIEDLKQYHRSMESAIIKMIDIHSKWGSSMIIEGYAVYPHLLNANTENVEAIYLLANDALLLSRLNKSKAFEDASDKAKQNYLQRSLGHNQFLREECEKYNCKSIQINGTETVDEIVKKILEITGFESINE